MCYITTTDSPSVGTQHFAVSTLPYYGPRHFRTIRRVYNWRYYTTKGSAALASITPDQGKPRPEFSKHWLESYKKRHQVRLQQRFGEDASVPESAEDEMKALRTLAART